MKRIFVLLVFLVGFGVLAQASLRVTDFQSAIVLEQSGELQVTETIGVTFFSPHHGIERWIPVSYRRPTGERITVGLRVTGVTMDGGAVPYTVRDRGGTVYLRIGDPDRLMIGDHTYTISYTVSRALLFHADYIQLYWNVTGNEWSIPIDHATAVLTLPPGIDPDHVRTVSYVGYAGDVTRGAPAQLDSQGRFVFAADGLAPGEGLTIDVAVPRDEAGIAAPSAWQRTVWFLSANKYGFLPPLTLIGMFLLWFKVGKDPDKGTIAPRFSPPKDVHPGEAGILIDDRADLRDITAMVIGLAVAGYIKIREIQPEEPGVVDQVKKLFGRAGALDYEFIKLRDADDKLTLAEKRLMNAIFDSTHPEVRTLSSLENEFYQHLPQIKSDLYSELIKRGYYPHNPERVRGFYLTLGLMIIGLGVFLGMFASSLYLGITVGLCGLIVLAFSPIMPRKTKKGVQVYRDLLGLSEYIRRAEVKQMEFHDAPEKDPRLFSKLLPYAMAFNLTRIWTKQFEGLLQEPPDWYVGAGPVYRGNLFYLSMMNLSNGMERTFVSAPRTSGGGRSAWGGGASFGGGFSGGGFGGGGGGGW